MKLLTTIEPRKTGKVIVREGGQEYEFEAEHEGGDLVGTIGDKALVARLLASGDFYPANEGDYVAAGAIMDDELDDQGELGTDDLDDDLDEDNMPPPVEANTPPKPPKAKPANGKKAKA